MDVLFLANTTLFQGCAPGKIEEMLRCLQAREQAYHKGQRIYHAGDVVQAVGMVLSGGVRIESDDLWGNRSILSRVDPGQLFAEAYACAPGEPMLVSAVADAPTVVLFLNVERILHTCPSACDHHRLLIRNLLSVLAQKNLNLSRRILHTSSKAIRGRLISYLSFLAAKQGSRSLVLPFDRQQLADYLSVDRSALSHELSKMQKEGLVRVDRNHVTLKDEL